jgi:Heavy metal binding domain
MNKLNKVLFVAALASALVFLAAGCTGSSRNDTATQSGDSSAQKVIQYTCPMHPEVVQDKPGACPKCGMTLVEKR